ncbi:hypothetical protein glysoja_007305 [Glycine soja]|nr:hypothetical protein glysoja_007305 [Glycine soja]
MNSKHKSPRHVLKAALRQQQPCRVASLNFSKATLRTMLSKSSSTQVGALSHSQVVKACATARLAKGNDDEENAWCIADGKKVVVVVVVMVYDEWACVTRWVESEFDDVGGSQNDDIALEVACELVAKEVVIVVEGEVP